MQVILGAGGSISKVLASELTKYDKKIRLVSRNPKKINPSDEIFSADLSKGNEVFEAVKGSDIAYLTIGLPYRTRIWQQYWPLVMKNVIAACIKQNCKLVFFDNIYMYDCTQLNPMTEETPVNPCSKKGKVRAEILAMLQREMNSGNINALIARAADFYGPGITNSVMNETVFKNLKANKKANWFCNVDKKHSFTYTPDAAKATAILGNTDKAYGDTWHLPTSPPLTGKEWIKKFALALNTTPKTMVVSKFMVKILGLVNPIMKEFVEMIYQYDRDCDFDSSKFETIFNVKPTSVEQAISEIVEAG